MMFDLGPLGPSRHRARKDAFPGLGADRLRSAVRDTAITESFAKTLTAVIEERS